MSKYLVALDQGTTSSRAVIFTLDGQVVGSYNREFPQHYPKPGWVEHDPKDILETQILSLQEAVRLADIRPEDIAAIGRVPGGRFETTEKVPVTLVPKT